MSMQNLLKNLDRGFYKDADGRRDEHGRKFTRAQHFAELAAKAGVAPSREEFASRVKSFFSNFGIDERAEKTFRGETVRRYAWETYALEKAFEDRGIKLQGDGAATVEKVFASNTTQTLFPLFFESQAVAGILLQSLVPYLVAQENPINSHTADHLSINDATADRQMSLSGEGARGTVLQVKTSEQGVKLDKYTAELDVTYEVVRLQRMDMVAVFFQRLGMQLGIDETDALIEVAIAGDGNTGSAVVDTDAEVTGVMDYDELIRLFLSFPKGYDMRQAIINDTNIRTVANMPEFKDPLAGFNFQKTGQLINPMNAQWHRWTSTGSASFSTDRILALDERLALIEYTEGGVMTESDRLIDRQFNRTVLSKWVGFGKLDYNATQCLDITT